MKLKNTSKPKNYNEINWSDWLYYDETSSTFLRWKVDRKVGKDGVCTRRSAHDVAGGINSRGYAVLALNGKIYKAHRVIWCLFYNSIPQDLEIDHIDGDRTNNCINNLRLISQENNRRNRALSSRNTTGYSGVRLVKLKGIPRYYMADWYSIDGHRKSKYFSIFKFGEETAFRLACEHRDAMIVYLRSQGADYTDRHGKEECKYD